MSTVRLRAAGIAALAGLAVAIAGAGNASAITGNQPLAVVLCKFTDRTTEPNPRSYYQDMFSETGAGKSGVYTPATPATPGRGRSATYC